MSKKIKDIPAEKLESVRLQRRISHRKWVKKDLSRYNSKQLAWANKNKEKRTYQARSSYLRRKFDLTIEDVNKMVKEQDNKCAICGSLYEQIIDKLGRKKINFHIDHNHQTGEIRGLLCNDCNWGVGYFKDSVVLLENTKKYLSHNSNRRPRNV